MTSSTIAPRCAAFHSFKAVNVALLVTATRWRTSVPRWRCITPPCGRWRCVCLTIWWADRRACLLCARVLFCARAPPLLRRAEEAWYDPHSGVFSSHAHALRCASAMRAPNVVGAFLRLRLGAAGDVRQHRSAPARALNHPSRALPSAFSGIFASAALGSLSLSRVTASLSVMFWRAPASSLRKTRFLSSHRGRSFGVGWRGVSPLPCFDTAFTISGRLPRRYLWVSRCVVDALAVRIHWNILHRNIRTTTDDGRATNCCIWAWLTTFGLAVRFLRVRYLPFPGVATCFNTALRCYAMRTAPVARHFLVALYITTTCYRTPFGYEHERGLWLVVWT